MSIKSLFEDIADAIREKSGNSDTYTPAEMPEAIRDIVTGGGAQILHNEHKSSTTGAMNLIASINIPSAGSYIINAGGYVDTLTVKINNVSQPLTYERSLHYVRFYLETKTLNAGDMLDIAAVGSGNTCALISVIKEV